MTCPEGKTCCIRVGIFLGVIFGKCGVNHQFVVQDFVGGECTSPLISSGTVQVDA